MCLTCRSDLQIRRFTSHCLLSWTRDTDMSYVICHMSIAIIAWQSQDWQSPVPVHHCKLGCCANQQESSQALIIMVFNYQNWIMNHEPLKNLSFVFYDFLIYEWRNSDRTLQLLGHKFFAAFLDFAQRSQTAAGVTCTIFQELASWSFGANPGSWIILSSFVTVVICPVVLPFQAMQAAFNP